MRSAATLFIGYLLLILQSTLHEVLPPAITTPNFGLLVVLFVGLSQRWTPASLAVISLATGYLTDLVSGSPPGVHAFVFIVIALLARALATQIVVRGIIVTAACGFMATLLGGLLVVIVRAQVSPEGGYGGLSRAPVEALITAFFAPPVLALLRQVNGHLEVKRARVGISRGRRGLAPESTFKSGLK